MESNNDRSFIMAERLKRLREAKGLSHEKLSKVLFSRYEVKISPDSLINYEVSDPNHSKARKNQGMRIEYLQCFADFYGVSADYILGANVPQSPDITVKELMDYTGLSEDNILSLHAWNNIDMFYDQNGTSNLPAPIVGAIEKAKYKLDKKTLGSNVIELISGIIRVISNHPRCLSSHFTSFKSDLCNSMDYLNNHSDSEGVYIDDEIIAALQNKGITIIGSQFSADWHLSVLCQMIGSYLKKEMQEELGSKK